MKKGRNGFTLIELLIVTVVIVALMGIVFRLAGIGGASAARAKTIARLQRLSNAIGGYYAAFGSYPPVPLQGRSRSIYTRVDGTGVQYSEGTTGSSDFGSGEMAKQIEAACRAQPVALGCPFNSNPASPVNDMLVALGSPYKLISNYGGFNRDTPNFSENSVFTFGLMSFLMPRYELMMDGVKEMYDTKSNPNGPWAANNKLPFLLDGTRLDSWADAQNWLSLGADNYNEEWHAGNLQKSAMLRSLPSQAVCARWMPNLEGIVTMGEARIGGGTFFGVNVVDGESNYLTDGKAIVISPSGAGGAAQYIQNGVTVRDGWNNDFYYYSPPPYQSYTLWSSGPDGRTFPPWMEKPSGEESRINTWIADDIKAGDK